MAAGDAVSCIPVVCPSDEITPGRHIEVGSESVACFDGGTQPNCFVMSHASPTPPPAEYADNFTYGMQVHYTCALP